MIRKLLILKATPGLLALRLVLLTAVACCLHPRAMRADEPAREDGEAILPASALELSSQPTSECESLGYFLVPRDDAAAPIRDADDDLFDLPLCEVASSAAPAATSDASTKKTWIPQGVIPYIGPRTPDAEKDRGIGRPLPEGLGWRRNPFAISGFSGVTAGNAFIPHHVNQQASYYGGLNIAWDYDHYWGIEKRLGFGALSLTDCNHHPIHGHNVSVTGEYRLMYYPLGDARWRPFLTSGLGWSDFYFNDDRGDRRLDTVGMVPFGVGVKYLQHENLAMRVDLIDELTFGAGALSTFHYVALTAGLEVRYGRRLFKWPWHRGDADAN